MMEKQQEARREKKNKKEKNQSTVVYLSKDIHICCLRRRNLTVAG